MRVEKYKKLQTGYEGLAQAIVLQACHDYVRARMKGKESEADFILKFFRGSWFESTYDLDPEYIIEKLNKKIERKKADEGKKAKRLHKKRA